MGIKLYVLLPILYPGQIFPRRYADTQGNFQEFEEKLIWEAFGEVNYGNTSEEE